MDARFVIMMVMGVLMMGWVVFCGIQFIRHSRNPVSYTHLDVYKRQATECTITAHEYTGEWKYDKTGHWRECDICNDPSDMVKHTFGEWVVTKEPTTVSYTHLDLPLACQKNISPCPRPPCPGRL